MNLRLLSKLLGIVAMLIGGTMVFSLPWAHPMLGWRRGIETLGTVEWPGLIALVLSILICFGVGGVMIRWGREAEGKLFRKEAMAVVGLSWVLATVLGALPFYFAGVKYVSSVRLFEMNQRVQVFSPGRWNHCWVEKGPLSDAQFEVLVALNEKGSRGLREVELNEKFPRFDAGRVLKDLTRDSSRWGELIHIPESSDGHYRIKWLKMGIVEALFESQSGFSTTGATIIADLETPEAVPHCILFWRSSTHFLGGLGIIVLFVVILGQGSAGKALMRAEMPGPTKEGSTPRMQETAWLFTGIYVGLNLVLAIILMLCGMSMFDALCHAAGTMATGGFSTYNTSVGHFQSAWIDYWITLFMILAGTNFTLLFLLFVMRQPSKLFADFEWRVYMGLILGVTFLIVVLGIYNSDFARDGSAFRYALFQVVAIITTTGYGTHDFDAWNSFGRGVLLILMFVGGCAGSTGGGMKVIRHIFFVKILRLELEQSFHPRVVRPLRIGGSPVDDQVRRNILVYFALILIIFVLSWQFLITTEPSATWGVTDAQQSHKLIDSASAVAATLNNIGPGLGIVGATQNYAYFSSINKTLFVWLMMIGRLEIFAILVLFAPSFWRDR